MTLEQFLNRLKAEYHTLDKLTHENYYQRLSALFVVLELDGDALNEEHELYIDQILDKLNDINEQELQLNMATDDLAKLIRKVKTGLALLLNQLEE